MSESTCSTIAVLKETTYGTQATGTYVATEFQSSDFTPDTSLLTRDTINGSRGLTGVARGPYSIGGSIQMLSNPEGIIPRLIEGLLGNVVTTNLGSGAYQHVFNSIGCSKLPSYTVYEDKLTGEYRTLGAKVASLDLGLTAGQLVTMNFGLMGKKDQKATRPTISRLEPRPFVWADATVTLGGVANVLLEDLSMSISNEMTNVWTLNGSIFPNEPAEQGLAVSGSFNTEFGSEDELEIFWGAVGATEASATIAPRSLVLQYVSPDEIASSGQYYTLKVDLKALVYDSVKIPLNYNERIMYNTTFVGTQDITDTVVEITIINGEASYA